MHVMGPFRRCVEPAYACIPPTKAISLAVTTAANHLAHYCSYFTHTLEEHPYQHHQQQPTAPLSLATTLVARGTGHHV